MRLSLNKTLPAEELKAISASLRWRREQAGTYFNGTPLRTDDVSQGKCNGAVSLLQNQPEGSTINFKTPDGFVTLDLPSMTAIALAVGAHVQACFSKEEEVQSQIEAGTITMRAQVESAYASIPSPGYEP